MASKKGYKKQHNSARKNHQAHQATAKKHMPVAKLPNQGEGKGREAGVGDRKIETMQKSRVEVVIEGLSGTNGIANKSKSRAEQATERYRQSKTISPQAFEYEPREASGVDAVDINLHKEPVYHRTGSNEMHRGEKRQNQEKEKRKLKGLLDAMRVAHEKMGAELERWKGVLQD